jgi:hypothetical protein
VWYAVLAAYVVDRIGSGVWVELDGIVWALSLIAYEPDKSTEVGFDRADTGFCKFANCKENIGTCVVGKIEDLTAEQKGRCLCRSSMMCLS